ncbi:CBO0543 family protein [Virgibacillus ihumii]|uniref:CBO0543 family protein n=1 Tax=Virgibacillus ihumii TaxID=2686091 RepID=UPI00157CDC5D|nr:CBO0543 family protein [Virgibacillus ihumii]
MDVQSVFEKNSMLFRFAYEEKFQIWLDHILFTWRWWLGIAIILACLWICYYLSRNESGNRLLFVGFFTALVAAGLDLIGVFFGLWEYRYEVFPSIDTYLPWDLLVVPTLVMVLIRFKPQVNPLVKALVLGAVTSFIGLPFLNWLGLYELLNWNYIYSFPIQVVIYLLADAVSRVEKFAPLRG